MAAGKRENVLKCPYNIQRIEFSHCSVVNAQDSKYSKRNIIIGGVLHKQVTFLDAQVSLKDGNHVIEYKSFEKDYQKLHARLHMTNSTTIPFEFLDDAEECHSFLINDNKHLMVFNDEGSNVYDIENDAWLLNKKDESVIYSRVDVVDDDRVLLITDEIFVISYQKDLYFYFINKNDVAHPKLLKKYTIKQEQVSYEQHGLVCTKLEQTNDVKPLSKTGNTRTLLTFEMIIFGGRNIVFGKSFFKFIVDLSYDNVNINIDKKNNHDIEPIINIEEKQMKINCDMIENNNDKSVLDQILRYFGYQCLLNRKKEPVIIIVGGYSSKNYQAQHKSIILFNIATNTMELKPKFLPFVCDEYPATTICSMKDKYCQFQSIIVLMRHQQFVFDIYGVDNISWDIERLIWIAFYKNNNNNINNGCLLAKLPKDLIKCIIRFVGIGILDKSRPFIKI